jgi:hypothetical protein
MVSMMSASSGAKTPWHLWAVGVVAVLWNAYGGYDYVMSMTQGATYMAAAGMTPEQVAFYEAMPSWMTAVWAIGVWGGVLGSLLLLLRNKLAFPVFAVSFGAFLLSLLYVYGLNNGSEVMGFMMKDGVKVASSMIVIMNVVIATGCAAFTVYARAMAKRGVLR